MPPCRYYERGLEIFFGMKEVDAEAERSRSLHQSDVEVTS